MLGCLGVGLVVGLVQSVRLCVLVPCERPVRVLVPRVCFVCVSPVSRRLPPTARPAARPRCF